MRLVPILVAALLISQPIAFGADSKPSDDEIRQLLIRDSISRYSGPCACPYSRARNGSRCGRRSAYSRPGGAAPLCFPGDVSDQMVAQYRRGDFVGLSLSCLEVRPVDLAEPRVQGSRARIPLGAVDGMNSWIAPGSTSPRGGYYWSSRRDPGLPTSA